MSYLIQNNDIYDHQGNVLAADENGIVKVVIDNKERRFVKEKFISYLATNPGIIKGIRPARKLKKTKPVKVAIVKVKKPRKKQKHRKIETVPRERNGIKVTAMKDGITYGPFRSLSACAREIDLVKSTITKIMNGTIVNSSWSFIKQ